jgi:hypothetical protein
MDIRRVVGKNIRRVNALLSAKLPGHDLRVSDATESGPHT